MKKFLSISCIVVLGGACLALFKSTSTRPPEFVLKFATIAPEGTPWSEQVQALKQRIEKESNGRIEFRIYLSGQLGGEVETLRGMLRGRTQGWGGSAGALASVIEQLQIVEFPYLFKSEAEADYILDSVLYEPFAKMMSEKGIVLHSWNENGWRNIGSKSRPIHKPEDLKGMKIRSQQEKLHLAMWQAWGANAVAISLPEVLSALQTGVVDAFDNSPVFTTAASWHTAITYYTISEHIYQPAAVVYNKNFIDSLPEDLRKVVLADPHGEAKRGRAGVRAIIPEVLALMEQEGVTFYRMTEAEKDTFRKLSLPLHEQFAEIVGRDLLNRVYAAQAEFRKTQKANK